MPFTELRGTVEVPRARVYVDDVKSHRNAAGEHWLYIGVLLVAQSRFAEALALLLADRSELGCDSELHFSHLTSHGGKDGLARRWVERVVLDDRKLFNFHVLGISLDRLRADAFGDTGSAKRQAIYTRFLRTAVSYALIHTFGTPVRVERLVHDGGNLESHPYFDWHAPHRIALDHEGISFKVAEVLFVDSDHRKEHRFPDDSHFVQLADLVVGAIRQVLDNTSTNKAVLPLADCVHPLLSRLMNPNVRRNINSHYNHVRRCSVSFFPTHALSAVELADPWERSRSRFYRYREALYSPDGSQQQVLFR